ncbi:MAG: hypothetical protein J6X46_01460 [Prevotella sp.]|nr:hypothetical protein [Prevotella sp.]
MPHAAAFVAHVHVLAEAAIGILPHLDIFRKAVVAGQDGLDRMTVLILLVGTLQRLKVVARVFREDSRSLTLARIDHDLVEAALFDERLELAVIDGMEGGAFTADEHIGDEQTDYKIYVEDVEVEMKSTLTIVCSKFDKALFAFCRTRLLVDVVFCH